MIRVLISGCGGAMGTVIERYIKTRDDCTVCCGVDKFKADKSYPVYPSFLEVETDADVIIDFSHPSLTSSALSYAAKTKTPIVVATTGLSDEQKEEIVAVSKETAVFFTANMSIGVNLLVSLAKKAAAVLSQDFDIEIVERHHNKKVDSPSGTALMLANAINEDQGDCFDLVFGRYGKETKRKPREMTIHAVRGGTIAGDHDVIFAGNNEVITLSHHAQSKEVFATGSVNAAIFISKEKEGLYDMSDMLGGDF